MNETLVGLVSQYSPSGQEAAAVRWLVERMKALGYDQAFIDGAGNAVGVMGSGARQVVLLGHIDTVPGEIPVRVAEGVLHGRGAVDAKGALACFVDAAAGAGAPEGWQVVVIGAVGEERDSRGAYYAAERYRPEYAIIGEPNRWERVALGYKGTAWAQITTRRGQAHTAGGGKTACEAALEVWGAIRAFADAYNAGNPRVFDQVQPTLNHWDAGEGDFEQWARLKVGVRLPPALPPAAWYDRLEQVAGGVQVERLGQSITAWTCDKNTRLVRALLAGIRGAGGSPAFVYKTGTADLNIVAPVWGCPALVYGPGDSALDHTPDEKIDLGEYGQAVQVLASALGKLMQAGR
ncbi:MAG: [LysW]-lysine hydrolase [Anaerolineae bacterium]|nr:[LysW]-lysine hydrolase [Anaerolineae bacterium]